MNNWRFLKMTILSHNEIELLEASINGNAAAFESIVKKYQSFVCAITYSAVADVEKSEDMAQETFLHVWNNLSKLKDLTKFKSWLISIVRNIINDSLRKQKNDFINKAAPIEQVEDMQISRAEPDNKIISIEQQAVVYDALMQIPGKYREPLVLFYRQGQSVKNIAGQLDLSEELVKQHLSRGRKMLREQVASMVESAISKTGPTKAFTTIVMASIAGLALKGTATTAAAAGTSAIISSLSAKIITAAAVIAIGIVTVATYNHFTKQDTDNQIVTSQIMASEKVQVANPDRNLPAANLNFAANSVIESAQTEITSAINTKNDNIKKLTNNTENTLSRNSSSNIPVIALTNKPASSPYEYFLFTRYTQQPSTKTLVLAHITDNGIELKDIATEDFGSYRWGDMFCVAAGKLYSKSYNILYSIDLSTKEIEQFPVRSRTLDYSFGFNTGTVFSDNSLYGLAQRGDTITLRQLDFKRGAFRDIADIPKTQPNITMVISPDKKRLAYFSSGNRQSSGEGYLLTIVDIESGKITQPAKPIKFIMPMLASSFPSIPVIWLDNETVAFIQSEAPEGESEFSTTREGVNMLSTFNINTATMEDITPLPGNPYMQFAPNLIQGDNGIGPRVTRVLRTNSNEQYLIDLKNRKLVENDLIGGDYGFALEKLHCKDLDLGMVKSRYFTVSPDGKRIIWMSVQPAISDNTQNKEAALRTALTSGDGLLYYHDEAQREPAAVANVYNSAGLWLKAEDLKTQQSKIELSKEWTPLKDISKNLPVQPYVETRKNLRDYLTCTIKTDKTTYRLHEPVQVTLTLMNKSSSDIPVTKPRVFGSVNTPLLWVSLSYPGGGKSINCGAQPYSPQDEEILLKPGQSVSDIDVLEVSLIGDYKLDYKYQRNNQPGFIGLVAAEQASFNIVKAEDAAAVKQLFDAKFVRIMEKFHRDTAKDPNWFGSNNVSDELLGLPGLGQEAAPYIIKAIDGETNKYPRSLLLRALSSVAGPQYIPYFRERLVNGETDTVCDWLIKTYTQSGTNENIRKQAVEALIAGMSNAEVEARQRVCNYLTTIYDKNIETCFTKAVEDEDDKIRQDAGFYLAAAKWLDLADWLKLAAAEPTYVQYISASAVITKLEQQWNVSKGKLPTLSKEDFKIAEKIKEAGPYYKKVLSDWLSWAQENPRASFLFFEEYRQTWWKNDPLRQD
jgi:RNA polymerase sigma factor (sigma-70 family)